MEEEQWRAIHGIGKTEKGWFVVDAAGGHITGWGSVTQTEANARLIAAAPRMYTELEAGIAIIDGFRRGEEMDWDALDVWWRGAKAAIAEATAE